MAYLERPIPPTPGSRELRGPKMVTGSDALDALIIIGVLTPAVIYYGSGKLAEIAAKAVDRLGNNLYSLAEASKENSAKRYADGLRRLERLGR